MSGFCERIVLSNPRHVLPKKRQKLTQGGVDKWKKGPNRFQIFTNTENGFKNQFTLFISAYVTLNLHIISFGWKILCAMEEDLEWRM